MKGRGGGKGKTRSENIREDVSGNSCCAKEEVGCLASEFGIGTDMQDVEDEIKILVVNYFSTLLELSHIHLYIRQYGLRSKL